MSTAQTEKACPDSVLAGSGLCGNAQGLCFQVTARFQPALGEPTLCGVAVDVSDSTGLAEAIGPVRIGGRLAEALPTFW